jgi:hypothetical protein
MVFLSSMRKSEDSQDGEGVATGRAQSNLRVTKAN